MGQAKLKRRLHQANGFKVQTATICEYELCSPGQPSEQNIEFLCAALPEDDDFEITRRALGAPVSRFVSEWDGAKADIYVIEDGNKVPSDARVINAVATLAWQVTLAKRGVSSSQILQEAPLVGPVIVRRRRDYALVRICHPQASEIMEAWIRCKDAYYSIIDLKAQGRIDFYLKVEGDTGLLRELYNSFVQMADAA